MHFLQFVSGWEGVIYHNILSGLPSSARKIILLMFTVMPFSAIPVFSFLTVEAPLWSVQSSFKVVDCK